MRRLPPTPSFFASKRKMGTAGAAVSMITALVTPARAVEREHHLGVDLGGSMLVIGDKSSPDVGPAVGAHWAYGLGDAFNVMAEGAWSLVSTGEAVGPKTPATRPSAVTNVDVGIGYVFDV